MDTHTLDPKTQLLLSSSCEDIVYEHSHIYTEYSRKSSFGKLMVLLDHEFSTAEFFFFFLEFLINSLYILYIESSKKKIALSYELYCYYI